MRILGCLTVSLLGAVIALAHPPAASAQDDRSWEACAGATATPHERVTACSTVIDAKGETGHKLAAAHCNRGYGLTEKRDFDAPLADLDQAIKIDPAYACAYSNRGRVYAFKHDLDRAIADYDEAIRINPSFAL